MTIQPAFKFGFIGACGTALARDELGEAEFNEFCQGQNSAL